MKTLIIFIFFNFTQLSYGYNYEAYPILNINQYRTDVSLTYDSSEIEYEKNNNILTQSESKYLKLNLQTNLALFEKLTMNIGISASVFGELAKSYDSSLNLRDEKIDFRGLQSGFLSLKYDLPLSDEKSKYIGEIFTKGSLQNAKETNNAYGGFDGGIKFHFSHKHKEHYFIGNIESTIVGRKKTKLYSGEKETVNSYSKFGSLIGYLYEDIHFITKITSHFYHTTDYNIKSPKIKRTTDKGFIWGGELKIIYPLRKEIEIYLAHMRETFVFNIVESHNQGAIDFEIERNETQLGLSWLF